MTDPTRPRPRGRHAQPDAEGSGRPASELLASWASSSTMVTDEPADATMRPRRSRRYAPETDATGVQVLARPTADAADVEITGLEASGIANVGLAAAGLDVSSFGIDRRAAARPASHRPAMPPIARRTPAAAAEPVTWGWTSASAAAPATAEMPAAPPAVPHLADDERTTAERRVVPAPRAAVDARTADRVVADRFADTDTDPGWLPATSRPVADAPQAAATPQAGAVPQAAAAGTLAALFADEPAPRVHAPVDEPATEVQAALTTGELGAHERHWEAESRHRGGFEDDADREGHPYEEHPHEEHVHDEHLHDEHLHDEHLHDEHLHDEHLHDLGPATGAGVFDQTGGLEVIAGDDHHDDHHDDHQDDHGVAGGSGGGGRGRRRGGSGGGRKRRGPITVVLSLLVLLGIIGGLAFGGLYLWRNVINPVAEDYSGTGTGTVQVRVNEGDSLRAIGGTLKGADVIASVEPFADAAEANPLATSIQPGVYSLRLQMSGKAALDLLLDPASRMVSKVTIPEGKTVEQTLTLLSEQGGLPLDQLQAALADPVALGLPPYANGLVEGFLFPATYEIEPDQTAVQVLSTMVARTDQVLTDLQIPVEQRLATLTEASLVQAEAGSIEDMGKVATVLDNRLADGMLLQLDTTVNYANGKGGITTTADDRANPSLYNTYVHAGLPPGAINNPGEEALRAVQNPTPGDWRFFVVVNPDTGETRFAATGAEHQQNVLLFQQWLRDNPGN